MPSQKYNRTQSLQSLARAKQRETLERVENALINMGIENIPITFQAVSKIASVSKAWLYGNADIASRIRAHRDKSPRTRKLLDQNAIIKSKNKEIVGLKKRIDTMSEEIERLKEQLRIVYGQLYKLGDSKGI